MSIQRTVVQGWSPIDVVVVAGAVAVVVVVVVVVVVGEGGGARASSGAHPVARTSKARSPRPVHRTVPSSHLIEVGADAPIECDP